MHDTFKADLLLRIIEKLNSDLTLFFSAAKTAHEAATHEENQPDNKYDTLALEASYVAQGQANRAQELRQSIEIYKNLPLPPDSGTVRLASLVTLETDNGSTKLVFIGPVEGGMKIETDDGEVMVITPASPLGKALMGKSPDETVAIAAGGTTTEYLIIEVR